MNETAKAKNHQGKNPGFPDFKEFSLFPIIFSAIFT